MTPPAPTKSPLSEEEVAEHAIEIYGNDSNLQVYLPLNNSSADLSGNNRNGTIYGPLWIEAGSDPSVNLTVDKDNDLTIPGISIADLVRRGLAAGTSEWAVEVDGPIIFSAMAARRAGARC